MLSRTIKTLDSWATLIRRQFHDFSSLGVGQDLVASLANSGIINPSPVQQLGIPAILSGKNCGLQSCTGSGKTLTYVVPAIMRSAQHREVQLTKRTGVLATIVAPSRELCMQTLAAARRLLPADQQQLAQQLIGGANPKRQREALRRHHPVLVVGTPGRLLEFIRTGTLAVERCPLLILDEVDQLSSPEFREEVKHVVAAVGSRLSSPRQTVVVSASLSRQQLNSLAEWCPGAEYLSTYNLDPGIRSNAALPTPNAGDGRRELEAELSSTADEGCSSSGQDSPHSVGKARLVLPQGLNHHYILTSRRKTLDCLDQCLHAMGVKRALVFAGSQGTAMHVRLILQAKKLQATVLHSKLTKLERTNIINAFRRGVFQVMVVTDVASRGLDFPEVDAVFNLGLPEDAVDYAHRAGRTNRLGGVPGRVVSIVEARQLPQIQGFSRRLGVDITPSAVSFGKFMHGSEK